MKVRFSICFLKYQYTIAIYKITRYIFFIGTRFKKVITNLEESLEIKTTEAQHLTELVAKMESSSSSDEMNKVQIGKMKNMTL